MGSELRIDAEDSIGDAVDGMNGPVMAIREASSQARHHFTQADPVNQLTTALEHVS